MSKVNDITTDTIKIEINAATLARALADGSITACEIRGLNIHAKQSLWRLCLNACIKSQA